MVLAHNLMAQNAQRMFGINNNQIVQTMEKLSSGYRINRSADDAAGLAISEKMRCQIRGLNRASLNALDGISVIQTAEGAFGEMQAMLHRINELCTQAANDTNTHVDRKQIQQEIDQLVYEIDDTTERTQFNTKKVLSGMNKYKNDGTIDKDMDKLGVPGKNTYNYAGQNLKDVFSQDIDPVNGRTSILINLKDVYNAHDEFLVDSTFFPQVSPTLDEPAKNTNVDYVSIEYKKPGAAARDTLPVIYSTSPADATKPYLTLDQIFDHLENVLPKAMSDMFIRGLDDFENTVRRDYGEDIKRVSFGTDERGRRTLEIESWADQNDPFKMMLQVGSIAGQGIEVSIDHLNARGLGITGIFVDSYEDACKGMKKAQDAIDKVSTARASLGAQQNRLEHTIKNLDNVAENTQASESRIRDTNMAKMMVDYAKNQILLQVGQSMMASVQRSAEGALALLG